jgi:SAM-dependent methyltransferase
VRNKEGEGECPLCGTVVAEFDESGVGAQRRPDCKCPKCGSLERHRAFWLLFEARTNLLTAPVRMLHIAAEPCIAKRIRSLPNVDYITADLNPIRGMLATDLTSMAFADESFDVILISHVLEHIPDDVSAMREIRRVLKRGGTAILAVPIWGPTTREDPIADPVERTRLYGQDDHVRMYGNDGVFAQRLTDAGFDALDDPLIRDLDPALRRRYRLRPIEIIYTCTYGVPAPPPAPTMLRTAVAGDGQATLSWDPPDLDEEPILGYVVTAYDGYWPELSVTFNSTKTTETVGGLTNGVTYRFKVAAFNAVGTGATSTVSNPVVPQS